MKENTKWGIIENTQEWNGNTRKENRKNRKTRKQENMKGVKRKTYFP